MIFRICFVLSFFSVVITKPVYIYILRSKRNPVYAPRFFRQILPVSSLNSGPDLIASRLWKEKVGDKCCLENQSPKAAA